MLEPDVTEVYLVPSGRVERCLVCTPSSEALVDALREGAFTLCPVHLLRAHVHGNDEDGVPSLRVAPEPPAPPPPPPRRQTPRGFWA